VPGDEEPPPYEMLTALVASLRRELAEAAGALEQARAELAEAQERIAELEARMRQNPRNSSKPPSRPAAQAGEGMTVAVTSAVTADSWPSSDGGATL
jgi:phage shock protein A